MATDYHVLTTTRRRMLRRALVVVSVLSLACLGFAAENVKLNGYIIDNMCAGHHGKDAKVEELVKNHKKSCALMDGCSESGYALSLTASSINWTKRAASKRWPC